MFESVIPITLIAFIISSMFLIYYIGVWVDRRERGWGDEDEDGGLPPDEPDDPDVIGPNNGNPLKKTNELREMIKTDIYVTNSGELVNGNETVKKREKELV